MINLKDYVNEVKDFPKKGFSFKDISPLLANGEALSYAVDELAKLCTNADVIVGPDARGFLFGTPVSVKLKKPFVMVRKKNKLPGEIVSYYYDLEYGSETLEIQKGVIKPGQKIIIIDDVLATGGTTGAIVNLMKSQGAIVTKVVFLIEIEKFKGRRKYGNIETCSLIKY